MNPFGEYRLVDGALVEVRPPVPRPPIVPPPDAKRDQEIATCHSKRRYDLKGVRSQINLIPRRGRKVELRYYSCPVCHGWHLSKIRD